MFSNDKLSGIVIHTPNCPEEPIQFASVLKLPKFLEAAEEKFCEYQSQQI